MVGIDAYFPLTEEPQTGYDKQKIIDGWTSGEGYDWYYSDVGRTVQTALTPAYAWKNLEYWWSHTHTNPVGGATAWVPSSKKIWFTEFGFPSVDGCANQPNVFYDPNSSESAFPYHSKGRVDFRAQRTAIEGTIDKWAGSAMVERMFLWAWDARPYPFYPDLRNVWADGNLWMYGHWVMGKIGLSSLSSILADLCKKVGLEPADVNVDEIFELVDGYVINGQIPARVGLEQLQSGYFFDSAENDTKLKFLPRGSQVAAEITEGELIPLNEKSPRAVLKITRKQEVELPEKVDVNYLDRLKNYQTGNQHYLRSATDSMQKFNVNLPIVFSEWQARRVAQISLFAAWAARNEYEFSLPLKYAYLEPSDIVEVAGHKLRLTETLFGQNGEIRCKAVGEDASVYDFYAEPANKGGEAQTVADVGETKLEILDLPLLPNDDEKKPVVRYAASGLAASWRGAVVYRSDDGGASFEPISNIEDAAVMGNALTVLASGAVDVFDEASKVTVSVLGGELEGRTELAILNGANLAALGHEIIQFKNAALVSENVYELSGLLRGRLGTEHFVGSHAAGERFVLLDARPLKENYSTALIGLARDFKPASVGKTLADTASVSFTFAANGLKPYSPVHIAGSRDGSGNLSINWVRRTRLGGDLRDGADVPLSEEFEKYEVDILNGLNVVRVISASAASAVYSAADQVVDFGSVQSSVSVRVYQLSAVVGRGNAGVVVV